LLPDETCWFLAADFDEKERREDAAAFLQTCRDKGIEACLERSRSGNGGHVWSVLCILLNVGSHWATAWKPLRNSRGPAKSGYAKHSRLPCSD